MRQLTQLGKVLGLNDRHILDTFILRLSSNNYVNLVHIDSMQATLNMANRFMAISKGTWPGASAILNIPFMAASSHDGLASGVYQKTDIPKTGNFPRFGSIKWFPKDQEKVEKSGQWFICLENERLKRQYKSPGRSNFWNRNWLIDNSRDCSRDSQDRDRRATLSLVRLVIFFILPCCPELSIIYFHFCLWLCISFLQFLQEYLLFLSLNW